MSNKVSQDAIGIEVEDNFDWGERLPDGSEIWHQEPTFKNFSIREKLVWILSVKPFLINYLLNPAKESMVLEFGCGTGGLAIDISRRRDVRVIGLDIYEKQAKIAHAQSAKYQAPCDFLIYKGENLPFANDSFDYIYSVDVFGHLTNLPHIIHELYRVAKHRARLAIFSESKVGRWSIVQHYLFQKGVNIDPHMASHISMHSKRELITMLEEAGFFVKKTHSASILRFIMYPEWFYETLSQRDDFQFLRIINSCLYHLKKWSRPFSTVICQFYTLFEILTLGRIAETSGIYFQIYKE